MKGVPGGKSAKSRAKNMNEKSCEHKEEGEKEGEVLLELGKESGVERSAKEELSPHGI